jgi:hypothetical protein
MMPRRNEANMGGKVTLEGEHHDTAVRLLAGVCEQLDRHRVPYWLEGGTLLGVMREQRLLPWDTDVDLSVTAGALPALQRALTGLRWRGYRVRVRRFERANGPLAAGAIRLIKIRQRRWLFLKSAVNVDVFVKYPESGRYYWSVGDDPPVLKSAEARFYDNLSGVDFRGRRYGVPQDFDGYLSSRYGNWRVPVKEWDFRRDDLAIASKQ